MASIKIKYKLGFTGRLKIKRCTVGHACVLKINRFTAGYTGGKNQYIHREIHEYSGLKINRCTVGYTSARD